MSRNQLSYFEMVGLCWDCLKDKSDLGYHQYILIYFPIEKKIVQNTNLQNKELKYVTVN